MREQSLFIEALERCDPVEQAAFLDEACGADRLLRRRIEKLLERHQQTGTFLEPVQPSITAAVGAIFLAEGPGTVIGPYKLLEQIGEGGMGVVYMAEQLQPMRRKVALKIIKPGMDTKQIIARFEAERQALALMDHPNIARVLDGGATESGRPYFVMELVRGIPITAYCDQAHSSIDDRLELFALVCQAVQHAHQKAIIHRDIKPSNVLITLHDGVPVPKIIDFGVAKATGSSLTDKTLYTGFTQFVGTPLYMSPEQAELSGLDIDTRSDVYSLGVLLYELLTGTTPFDQDTFRTAALDEVRRIIREQEPPRPSTRLSTMDATVATVSANRGSDPRHLNRTLRGELDWIVMKALEKDRRRRYETANDFAADVMRYLCDRPVAACPPSALYRFGKFARRNRAGLSTAGLLVSALVAGLTVSAWQAVRATRAEQEAEHLAADTQLVVKSLINDVIGGAAPAEARGQPIRVVELLRLAEGTLPLRFRGRPLAEATFRRALAEAYADLSHNDEAEQQIRRAVELKTRLLGSQHPETLRELAYQIVILRALGITKRAKQEEAIQLGRRVADAQCRILGPNHRESLATLCELGEAYLQHGDYSQAREILEPTLSKWVQVLGADATETLETQHALGRAWHGLGRLDIAESLLRSAVETRQQVSGRQHFDTLSTLLSLGLVLSDQGRIGDAIPLFREVVAGTRALHDTPYFGGARYLCGVYVDALREQGNPEAIRELCERWLRELLDMPAEPDPVVRSMKMVSLSCMAFWLAALPPGVQFDGELAVRAAEMAAEQGNDARDSNWTRLALVHLRLDHQERAEWALRESLQRRQGGDRFDWVVQALIHARRGELKQARAWFDRASAGDDRGDAPGVGYGQTRDEVASMLGISAGVERRRLHGPRELHDEGSPLARGAPPLATAASKGPLE